MTETTSVKSLLDHRVIICVGSGGVGKTTVSAALALRAASEHKSALVCTIDPAKRLASALGLVSFDREEKQIDPNHLEALGITAPAPLYAMMLDMKTAWDDFITRIAPPATRKSILSSRLYQSLSSALAGSQEYIAMEKLAELRTRSHLSVVVLDTPPTSHAMDFLDAPNRVLDFLDNDATKWLMTPALVAGKVGLQLFNLGGSYITKTLAKFTGIETLQELTNFLLALSSLNEHFRDRAQQVQALLQSKETAFLLVTSPNADRIEETAQFHDLLIQNQMPVAQIVVNRVHFAPSADLRRQAANLDPPLRERILKTLEELELLSDADQRGIDQLKSSCPRTRLVLIPRFADDVHDLNSLWRISRHLPT
jgi:anion-transporting  ArsA/GET3 family ATPase